MNDQLILKFPTYQAYKKEDFYVSPSNQKAYDFIESWPKWIKRIVNVFGPVGSGKSHLASILKNKTTCLQINSNELGEKTIVEFKTKEALIIENLDEKISEKLLFSIWNTILQDNKYLLVTSKKPINSFGFKLNDLMSRVTSSLIIGINLPSDDLISVILAKNFSDKQIVVEKSDVFDSEGVGFEALEASAEGVEGTVPVYRFLKPSLGSHFFTAFELEKDVVADSDDFIFEGVGFRAFPDDSSATTPIYRFFNLDTGGHFFTGSDPEKEAILNIPQLRYEGIAFFAFTDEAI